MLPMRLIAPLHAAERSAGRLRDALVDPARRERNVVLALVVYTLLWTLYGTIAKAVRACTPTWSRCIAWSRDLAWGYKHPPLAAALVWLWFHVFPVAEWSYYLLAMLMPALTLWIVWRGSADYLDVEKRIAGVALLTFVPFFNFHALKFNANTILLPLWAVTAFWFLRSYTTRSALYALLAGARRRRRHAGQILVGVSDRRPGGRRADRQTPRRLFPLGGALDHGALRRALARAPYRLAVPARLRAVPLCGGGARRQSPSPAPPSASSAIWPDRSATSRSP